MHHNLKNNFEDMTGEIPRYKIQCALTVQNEYFRKQPRVWNALIAS